MNNCKNSLFSTHKHGSLIILDEGTPPELDKDFKSITYVDDEYAQKTARDLKNMFLPALDIIPPDKEQDFQGGVELNLSKCINIVQTQLIPAGGDLEEITTKVESEQTIEIGKHIDLVLGNLIEYTFDAATNIAHTVADSLKKLLTDTVTQAQAQDGKPWTAITYKSKDKLCLTYQTGILYPSKNGAMVSAMLLGNRLTFNSQSADLLFLTVDDVVTITQSTTILKVADFVKRPN